MTMVRASWYRVSSPQSGFSRASSAASLRVLLSFRSVRTFHGPVVLPVPDGVVQGQPGVLIHPRVPRPEVMVNGYG